MRIVLAVLLSVAAAGFAVVTPPATFLVGVLPLLLAFFLGWVRFALDLVELHAADLVADLSAPVVTVLGFWRVSDSTWQVVVLLAAGALIQALPYAARARPAPVH